MALTATITNGFEPVRNLTGFAPNPVEYDGSTGTTYTLGRLVTSKHPEAAGTPKLVSLTSTQTVNFANRIVGVVAETIACAATNRMVKVYDNPFNVYTVSFCDQIDGTASAASTAGAHLNTGITSTAANLAAGALVYIYEGPGKGDVRNVVSHTTAGIVTVDRAFSATLTRDSKYIMLAQGSTKLTAGAVNRLTAGLCIDATYPGRATIATDPAKTGYLNVVSIDPENLTMDVMIAPAKHALLGGLTS